MELASGEAVLVSERFIHSLGRVFGRTRVTLTRGRIVYERRNALLGLIPMGTQTDTYPLANISAVGTATSIGLLKLLGGFILLTGGVALSIYTVGASTDPRVAASSPGIHFGGWWLLALGVFLLLYGIQVALDALQARFYVSTSGGQQCELLITITSKARAQALAEQVNKAIVQLHERVGPKITV